MKMKNEAVKEGDELKPFTRRDRARLPMTSIDVARQFLRYSLVAVDFKYEGLTAQEQMLCTEEQFNAMVRNLRLSK
jgi:hypothetical protein